MLPGIDHEPNVGGRIGLLQLPHDVDSRIGITRYTEDMLHPAGIVLVQATHQSFVQIHVVAVQGARAKRYRLAARAGG